VIVAEDLAAAIEDVLVQVVGRLVLAEVA